MTETSGKLVVTRMDGPVDAERSERQTPDWLDIETAIRRLDGKACTLLILGIGDAPVPHMAIGGGDDHYIVYTTTDNLTFHTLVNPQAPPGMRSFVAGGQRGEYASKNCVGLADVLLAAKTYAQTGENDRRLIWERK